MVGSEVLNSFGTPLKYPLFEETTSRLRTFSLTDLESCQCFSKLLTNLEAARELEKLRLYEDGKQGIQ